MTGYSAIRDAIIAKLESNYPDIGIYGEEIQQGYKRPAFFVQIIPEDAQMINKIHRQKPLLVVINYFTAAEASGRVRDMWSIADELDYYFGTHLQVGDRAIYIAGTNPEINDDVLQYQLNLSFIDTGDDVIEVVLDSPKDDGSGTDIMIPEPEIGYIADTVFPMRNLTIKGV